MEKAKKKKGAGADTGITIDGKDYPFRPTMGAMLRFKRETGREVPAAAMTPSDTAVWLWCCVASASAADGIPFGLTLMDFCDRLTPEQLAGWAEAVSSQATAQEAQGAGGNPSE